MSSSITRAYTNNDNYSKSDSTKIEALGGLATLTLEDNPNQSFTEDFADDTGFTYDSALVEFAIGDDIDSYATYATTIDLSDGGGVLTGVAVNGAAIAAGKLDLNYDDLRYVTYGVADNFTATNRGTVRIKYTPNYSNAPSTAKYLLDVSADTGNANRLLINHTTGAQINVALSGSNGSPIYTSGNFGAFNPVSGTTYDIVYCWDILLGESRVFIDGVQLGTTKTETGIRTLEFLTGIYIGCFNGGATTSNASFSDVIFQDAVYKTAAYTPEAFEPCREIQQIDKTPDDSTFGITYTTDEDINWSLGATTTGTLSGGAAITSGELDLTANVAAQAKYVVTGTISANKGAVKFKYKPGYASNPAANVILFSISNSDGSNNNRIDVYHDTANAFRLSSWNNAGAATVTGQPFGTKVLTQNTAYEIEFNYNFTVGSESQVLIIDGVQQGATATRATTKASGMNTITHLEFGNGTSANNKIDDVVWFARPQHSAAYTSGYTLPETRYSLVEGIANPAFSATGAPDGNLISVDGFTVIDSPSGALAPRYTFGLAAVGQFWWDGAAWSMSDETIAQTNTPAEILTNLPGFGFPSGQAEVLFKSYFYAGNTRGSICNISVEYTDQIYPTSNPWIMFNEATYGSELLSFIASITASGSDAIEFATEIDGSDYYINGSTLAASTGYGETNTAAEIETNKALFLTARSPFRFKAYLHSETGETTPTIDYYTFTYDASLPDVTITKIDVNGFFYKGDAADTTRVIKYRPYGGMFQNEGVSYVYDWKTISATPDADGFVSFDMPKNPAGTYWEIKLKKNYKITLENTATTSVDFYDLGPVLITD